MSAEKRGRDNDNSLTGLNSDEHIVTVFKYLSDHPETKIILVEGQIDKDRLVGRGRAIPNIVRGFMRHSMSKSDRNLVFSFTAHDLEKNGQGETQRFNLTMTKKAPSQLPNVPSLDLVYTGNNLESIDNGVSGKAFRIQGFHNAPEEHDDNPAEHKKVKESESSDESAAASLSDLSGQVAPVQPAVLKDAQSIARDLFLQNDPSVRREAVDLLMVDETIRAEARQKAFVYLKDEKKLEETLEAAYKAKFEAERVEEQRQHQALLAQLEEDKQNFLMEHRKAVQAAQRKILSLTANAILTNNEHAKYRESAMNLAASRLEKDPIVIERATRMAQRAILLEKRDGIARVDIQRPAPTNPIVSVTPEDAAAAAAFVRNNP